MVRVASPDLAATAKDGAAAWFNLFNNLRRRRQLKDVLAICIVIANFICTLAGLDLNIRMIFAFARDGGLPGSSWWKHVARNGGRLRAIWLGAVLSVAATLYSPAFAALAAGCALFLYVSYVMPMARHAGRRQNFDELDRFVLASRRALGADRHRRRFGADVCGHPAPFDILMVLGLIVLLLVLWFGVWVPPLQRPTDWSGNRQASRRDQSR